MNSTEITTNSTRPPKSCKASKRVNSSLSILWYLLSRENSRVNKRSYESMKDYLMLEGAYLYDINS